ncbi:MAG TPA: hypothetical protein VM802_31380 [Chitinophaga sp.]|uniref:hypothetical protein n=1 Tax=Chitinophaga sp. TaxID=1869181 RepID=UPI002D05B70D|nr:hypothetical protein [Chitinophaga sp.]HVI49410.1 hypothetical protein [Chitinophaga sp.]
MQLNSILKRSIEQLSSRDILEGTDCGLWRGLAGRAVLCNALYHYTNEPEWKHKSGMLTEAIGDHVADVTGMGYADGLSGIGWSIEWMARHKFLQVNTDELLEDIDDTMYKVVMFGKDDEVSFSNGTLGKAQYFLKRYESVNYGTHRYKTICLQECLVLLTDEINEKLDELIAGFDKDELPATGIENIGDSIFFLSLLLRHKLNMVVVETALYKAVKCGRGILERFSGEDYPSVIHDPLCRLAYAFYFAGLKYPCHHWRAAGIHHFDIFAQQKKVLPASSDIFVILGQLSGNTGEEKYAEQLAALCTGMDTDIYDLSLKEGVVKITMSVLGCIHPEMSSWAGSLLLA